MTNVYKDSGPDDPRIVNMDPVQKIWMYENWLADQKDQSELAKNHAYLLGSFWNPEAVKQLTDEGNVYASSDDEFEESIKLVKQMNDQFVVENNEKTDVRKRRRRRIQG